jgi:phytoene dehydrogenase-like protein
MRQLARTADSGREMREEVDTIIIGAGHNGLTCACYLAAAGMRVRVLERRGVVGGAAVTEEFLPGFRNSTASYTVSLLHPKVVRELRLHEHGLRIVERPFSNFLPLGERGYFKYGGSLAATQAELARFSSRDAERLPAFYRRIDRLIDALRALLLQTPPNVGGRFTDLLRAIETGGGSPGSTWRRDLLDLLTRAPATCSTGGSRPGRSRRPSASTPSSATMRAPMRPAPPTSSHITAWAR